MLQLTSLQEVSKIRSSFLYHYINSGGYGLEGNVQW